MARLAFVALLAIGCGEPFRSHQVETRDFIEQWTPVGTRQSTVVRVLRIKDIAFEMIPRSQCQGFVRDPRFQCRGGSAIFATYDTDLWSCQSPFQHPSLRSFLAFDSEERLADYSVFLDERK